MDIGIDRLRGGVNPDPRREGCGLVMVIENHRVPLLVCNASEVLSLNLVNHKRVPVVIMSHVYVVQPGHGTRLVGGSHIGMVPLRQQVHTIGIGKNQNKYGIVKDETGVRIIRSQQVIG